MTPFHDLVDNLVEGILRAPVSSALRTSQPAGYMRDAITHISILEIKENIQIKKKS